MLLLCVAQVRFSANWWVATSLRFSNFPAKSYLSSLKAVRIARIVIVVVVVSPRSISVGVVCKADCILSKFVVTWVLYYLQSIFWRSCLPSKYQDDGHTSQ